MPVNKDFQDSFSCYINLDGEIMAPCRNCNPEGEEKQTEVQIVSSQCVEEEGKHLQWFLFQCNNCMALNMMGR